MKGRPSIHQDKDVILKAQELFWEKGFNATSLSELSKSERRFASLTTDEGK